MGHMQNEICDMEIEHCGKDYNYSSSNHRSGIFIRKNIHLLHVMFSSLSLRHARSVAFLDDV